MSWLIEVAVFMTGVRVETIHSDMNSREREAIIDEFNDPASTLKILIGTSRLIGQGQNVQRCCHVLAILEPQSNLSQTQQIIGRVYCMGQTAPQSIYIVTNEYTFDPKRLAGSVKKFLAQQMAVGPSGRRVLESAISNKTSDAVVENDINTLATAEEAALRESAVTFITNAFRMPRDFLQPPDLSWADLGTDRLGEIYTPAQRRASIKRLKSHRERHFAMRSIVVSEAEEALYAKEVGATQILKTPKSLARKRQYAVKKQFTMNKCPWTFFNGLPFVLADRFSCVECTARDASPQCIRACHEHYSSICGAVMAVLNDAGVAVAFEQLEGCLSVTRITAEIANRAWAQAEAIIDKTVDYIICRPRGGVMARLLTREDYDKVGAAATAKPTKAKPTKAKGSATATKYTSKAIITDSDENEDEPDGFQAAETTPRSGEDRVFGAPQKSLLETGKAAVPDLADEQDPGSELSNMGSDELNAIGGSSPSRLAEVGRVQMPTRPVGRKRAHSNIDDEDIDGHRRSKRIQAQRG